MVKFERKEIKGDPILGKLLEVVKKNHKVPKYTIKELMQYNHPNMCQVAVFFAILPGNNKIYFSYEMATWYKHPGEFSTRVDSITLYDDFMEYEKTRLKGLHSADPGDADIPNQN